MIKMEEERIKVAATATATIRAAARNHLIIFVPTAERSTRDDAKDRWVFCESLK